MQQDIDWGFSPVDVVVFTLTLEESADNVPLVIVFGWKE
jgi:hypothetical protein